MALLAAVSAQFQVKVLLHNKSADNRMLLLAATSYAQRGTATVVYTVTRCLCMHRYHLILNTHAYARSGLQSLYAVLTCKRTRLTALCACMASQHA
jgi:hypothetical protein